VNLNQSFSTPAECTGSSGLVFHALQNQYLILKDTSVAPNIFQICIYTGSSAAITLRTVLIPDTYSQTSGGQIDFSTYEI
jgi:hypothetical protein